MVKGKASTAVHNFRITILATTVIYYQTSSGASDGGSHLCTFQEGVLNHRNTYLFIHLSGGSSQSQKHIFICSFVYCLN